MSGFSVRFGSGRRLKPAAVAYVLLGVLAAGALAQRVTPQVPRTTTPGMPPPGGTSGVGGGAGLTPTLPLPQAPAMRSIAPPAIPEAAAPAAPSTTAAPRVVRFRCEVAPDAESCREQGAPEGGGDDSDCTCATDYCFDETDPETEVARRICEKAQ